MRNKHIHIIEDAELLKTIYKQIEQNLSINKTYFLFKLWFKFLFYFSLLLLSYVLIFIADSNIEIILSYCLFGFVSILFAFNFSHDFSHNTIFKNKKANHYCFILIYTIVGAHAEAWKHRHMNAHHHAPNVSGYDSDLNMTNLIRVMPTSEYCWYHKYQHMYAPFIYTTYSLYWVFIKDFILLFNKEEDEENKTVTYYFLFFVQKIFYVLLILVLPLSFAQQNGLNIWMGFLFMHIFQSLFLLFTFLMTHHVEKTVYPTTTQDGIITTSWFMNQLKSSNDMHPFSETANFILGGFNNHIAHHLFPHIHHIHYPQLNKILYDTLLKHNIIPNQTSYWGGIVSHLRLLKKLSYSNPFNAVQMDY